MPPHGPFTIDVLDQALVQQSRWSMAGYDLRVSVNISAASLRDDELPDKIAALIARREVHPGTSPRDHRGLVHRRPEQALRFSSGCALSASSCPSMTSAPGSAR